MCFNLNRFYLIKKCSNNVSCQLLEFGMYLHLYSTFNGPMVESEYGELVTPFLPFYFILYISDIEDEIPSNHLS